MINNQDALAVSQTIKSGWISSEGPRVKEFESKLAKFLNRKFGCTVSSGTAALEIAIKSLDLKKNDEVIEDKGVKVFIDPAAVMYLLGTEMDYKKEEFSSTFVFNNPNETERCGCGESFKID